MDPNDDTIQNWDYHKAVHPRTCMAFRQKFTIPTKMAQERPQKPIFIAATPNAQADDVALARRLLLWARSWIQDTKKSPLDTIRKNMAQRFRATDSFAYNTGRAALYAILSALDLSHSDEVVIQAYTCMAVPTSILWTRATPVYADIDPRTLNASASTISPVISPKTRAVVVQHTFGYPSAIAEIRKFIDEENKKRASDKHIYLIEDCAHGLGGSVAGTHIGEWGDAAFFSFGQEKVLSCTQGGIALSKYQDLTKRLEKHYKTLQPTSARTIRRLLLHPILWDLIKKTYYIPPTRQFSIGRALILMFRSIGLLQNQADPENTNLTTPNIYRMSDAQAVQLLFQFKKLYIFLEHRKKIGQIYSEIIPKHYTATHSSHTYLRFPLLVEHPEKLEARLKQMKVIPGNWYSSAVYPARADPTLFGYVPGSCPCAEEAARKSINLPTIMTVSPQDAKDIAGCVMSFLANQ